MATYPENGQDDASRRHAAKDSRATTIDKSTDTLIRRVLCSQTSGNLTGPQPPLDELLPPLTSSNAVDIHLYAIIAVIMRDFVYSWYGKITSDQTFVEETIRIIAHCTRELEQRLHRIDLELLLLHEIPSIVQAHIIARRTACGPLQAPDLYEPDTLYHVLFPHPALSPAPVHGLSTVEQIKNEAAYRQLLVQGILVVLLPIEDLQNPCLRTLVSDVIADMILGNGIGGKASAGWLIWDGLAKALNLNGNAASQTTISDKLKHSISPRLEQFGLLSTSNEATSKAESKLTSRGRGLSAIFWRIVQYIYFAILGLRFILVGIWTASRNIDTRRKPHKSLQAKSSTESPITTKLEAPFDNDTSERPFLAYSIMSLLSQLLDLPHRIPWILGWSSLIQHHLIDGMLPLGATGAVLDRFLHNIFQQQLYNPGVFPQILQAVRNGIFPNNALGPSRPVPSAEEQRQIKRNAAQSILNLIPPIIASHYLASANASEGDRDDAASFLNLPTHVVVEMPPAASIRSKENLDCDGSWSKPTGSAPKTVDAGIPNSDPRREAQLRDIESVLDLFANQYMNKHMLYAIIELVVVRLVPEMQTRSVEELLNERMA